MTTITSTPAYSPHRSKSVIQIIGWVGLLAGTLDISCAFLNAYISNGVSPVRILRVIAMGFFGKEALTGGVMMPVYGLLFHYFIAYSFTAFFFWLYPNVKIMAKNIVITAIVYGVFIYVVMDLLILPLTKLPSIPFRIDKALIATGILIIAIGLPLSYFARRFYYPKNNV
jgi:hypothetical protein